jgi:hypothetical protein
VTKKKELETKKNIPAKKKRSYHECDSVTVVRDRDCDCIFGICKNTMIPLSVRGVRSASVRMEVKVLVREER